MRNFHPGHKLIILLCLAWTLAPIYWAINTSLQTEAQAQSRPAQYLPIPATWHNYAQLLGLDPATADMQLSSEIRRSTLNIFVECTGAMLLTTIIAVLAAYAFARLRFRFRVTVFYIVTATMALPAYATLIPVYRMMIDAHLINTYTGVVLAATSGILPLATWILYNYFVGIPVSLDEAALIDGAGRLRTLYHVTIPVARPGIVAVGVIAFLSAYSQFLFPLVLTTDIHTQPLTVVAASLVGHNYIPHTLLNASGVIAIGVPVIVTLLLSRYIVSGLLAGAVK